MAAFLPGLQPTGRPASCPTHGACCGRSNLHAWSIIQITAALLLLLLWTPPGSHELAGRLLLLVGPCVGGLCFCSSAANGKPLCCVSAVAWLLRGGAALLLEARCRPSVCAPVSGPPSPGSSYLCGGSGCNTGLVVATTVVGLLIGLCRVLALLGSSTVLC